MGKKNDNTLVKNDLQGVPARFIDMPQALPDAGNDCGKLREKPVLREE